MGPNMPVSSTVHCESPAAKCSSAILDSLAASSRASSSNNNHHSNHFGTVNKLARYGPVEYVESPPDFCSNVNESLKTKYIVLQSVATATSQQSNQNHVNGKFIPSSNGCVAPTDTVQTTQNGVASLKAPSGVQLPTPKRILYDREMVQIGWKNSRKWSVGTGMTNVGNTCYLNSTLQALFHVPSFANWLYSDEEHRRGGCDDTKNQSDCIICAMARTLKETQDNPNQSIKPHYVYSKLRLVCKHLVPGDQEDAHEFLRYLVEAMEKAYLLRFKNSKEFDNYTKETTPLNQILGGYLKSSVRCLSCDHVSVTFQHFQDLLLDIRKSSSIEEALDIHFARERLEDMGYKCESCKRKVSATKQFSMERAPITLCIQLKRFSMMGGKINKHVSFSPRLSLAKYSSRKLCGNNDERQMNYRLVSVVTHLGSSQHCGHYTAVGLTHTGNYYNFDDSSVRQIPVQNAVQSNAYIIFYELEDPNAMSPHQPAPKLNCTATSKAPIETNGVQKPFIGPVLPPNNTTKSSEINGHKVNGIEITNKPTMPNSKLVLNIGKIVTPVKPWNSPKILTTPVKTAVNGLLSTGLTPDMGNKLKVTTATNSATTALARPNHQKSDINTAAPALLSVSTHPTKPTLPSMPQLDATTATSTTKEATNTPPPKTNGHRIPITPPEEPPKVVTVKSNGHAKPTNGLARLVPYDDDSSDCANHSDDETNKSPPIVKTNSGLFIVTNATKSAFNGGASSPATNASSPVAANGNSSTNGVASSNGLKRFGARKPVDGDDHHDSATLAKLKKYTSNGYGAPVQTWDGKSSQMEHELKSDKLKEAERKREIDADADMDRGRQKKIKSKPSFDGDSLNPGFNPFTERQIGLNTHPRCAPPFQQARNQFKRVGNNNRY